MIGEHPLLSALGSGWRAMYDPPSDTVALLHRCGFHVVIDRDLFERLVDPRRVRMVSEPILLSVQIGATGEHTLELEGEGPTLHRVRVVAR